MDINTTRTSLIRTSLLVDQDKAQASPCGLCIDIHAFLQVVSYGVEAKHWESSRKKRSLDRSPKRVKKKTTKTMKRRINH